MTVLDADLRPDGGDPVGIQCPVEGCDWRFLSEGALRAHRAIVHDDGDPWRGDGETAREVVCGD